jgi:raffinose/stachyose/melibiose transport system substrate-binding protein
MEMKKMALVFLALFAFGNFMAFAGGGGDKGGGAKAQDGKVVLQVFHYFGQLSKQKGLNDVEAEFIKKYPNIGFENNYYNNGADYYQQLATALASGEQPNLIMGQPAVFPDVVANGYAMDLRNNQVLKDLNLPQGDLNDASANKILYAFPIDYKGNVILYNIDIFEKLGLQVPTKKSELLDTLKKIKAAGIDPWIQCYSDMVFDNVEVTATLWPRIKAAGDWDFYENLMSGKKKVTDYPYFIEALNNWTERIKGYTRMDSVSNNQDKMLELFVSGQGAMIYTGSWNIGDILDKSAGKNFRFGSFLMPIDENPATPKMVVNLDQVFMVNPKAKNADTALKFMEFWMTDGAGPWSEATALPLTSGRISDKAHQTVKDLANIKKAGNIVHNGDFIAPFNAEFNTLYRRNLLSYAESIVSGGSMTPAQCLANMQTAFDTARSTGK